MEDTAVAVPRVPVTKTSPGCLETIGTHCLTQGAVEAVISLKGLVNASLLDSGSSLIYNKSFQSISDLIFMWESQFTFLVCL